VEFIVCEIVTVFLYIMNMNFILQIFNRSHFLCVSKSLEIDVGPLV